MEENKKTAQTEEIVLAAKSGMGTLLIVTLAELLGTALIIFCGRLIADGEPQSIALPVAVIVAASLFVGIIGPILYCGLRIVHPNEARVLTLFGKYYGTLKTPGFFCVNPFAAPMAVPHGATTAATGDSALISVKTGAQSVSASLPNRKLSLKVMTLTNDKQKINDKLGNPIIIGIVVTWRVVDTAKAMFNVENFADFLSLQCDSALRSTVRLYPYDSTDEDESNETTLRGSSDVIARHLRDMIQEKVETAGLEVIEARITNLAYAPEIAAAMLQRQQASAVVDARSLIVEGAVGMVQMALSKLRAEGVIELDEERKAAMVSNLMVVLCANRETQPIVNSGSLY